jgi:hypothetical protein
MEIYWNTNGVRERTHKSAEMSWKSSVIQREQTNGVSSCLCLLSWIRAFLRYLLLQVTSTPHHHSLFDHHNSLLCQHLWAWYLQIVSPCPEQVDQMWTSVGGGDRRGSGSNNSRSNRDGGGSIVEGTLVHK